MYKRLALQLASHNGGISTKCWNGCCKTDTVLLGNETLRQLKTEDIDPKYAVPIGLESLSALPSIDSTTMGKILQNVENNSY